MATAATRYPQQYPAAYSQYPAGVMYPPPPSAYPPGVFPPSAYAPAAYAGAPSYGVPVPMPQAPQQPQPQPQTQPASQAELDKLAKDAKKAKKDAQTATGIAACLVGLCACLVAGAAVAAAVDNERRHDHGCRQCTCGTCAVCHHRFARNHHRHC